MNESQATMTADDLQAAFDLQKKAFLKDPYPSLKTRLDRMDRVIDMLVRNEQKIAEAVVSDFGRRPFELTRIHEVVSPLTNFKYARKNLPRWMKQEKRKSAFPYNIVGGKSRVQHVPLGVVGNISPWNFPFTLAFNPLAGILSAGNTCMLKPSELTPNSSQLMQELIEKNFAPEELMVAQGGVEVAQPFSQLPFDHLIFTGSTGVGAKVLASSAQKLVPTTLELGGKSPVIISDDADVDDVAKKLLAAKLMNAGQVCMCPDYVLVPENKFAGLVAGMQAAALECYPDQHESKDYTNIVSERHRKRLQSILDESVEKGNKAIPLFTKDVTIDDPRFLAPYLVEVNNRDCELMREELFGPLLPIIKVKDDAHAFEIIRENPTPLVVYAFTRSKSKIEKISTEVACGGMVFNEFYLHYVQPDLPFGGVGSSGMGSYNGIEGFKNFSHAKAVYKSSKVDVGKVLRPPFKPDFKKIVDKEIKV